MTPKGAAVLPRPFCCPFAFLRGRFAEPFFAFCRGRFAALFFCPLTVLPRAFCRPLFTVFLPPLPFFLLSSRPATFCELSPAPMATFCELFARAPRGQSLHFVNFWRHFAHPLSTGCKLFANFRLCPFWQSWHFVNFWRHFAHLRRSFCHLLLPFLPYFRFFLQTSRFPCKRRCRFPTFEERFVKAFRNVPFPFRI